MSTPLFLVGFTLLWVLMLCSMVPLSFVISFGATCLALLIIFLVISRTRQEKTVLVALTTAIVACAYFCSWYYFDYEKSQSFVDTVCEVKGTVIAVESKSDSGNNRYIVKVEEGPLKGYKLRLSSKYYSCEFNDTVKFKGKVYSVDSKAKRLYLGAYPSGEVEATPYDGGSYVKDLRLILSKISVYLDRELKAFLPKDYALLLKAMLVGEKSELPDDIYESFQKVGIVHILAVSGFHTSLWSMIVYRSLLKKGVNRIFSSLISIVFILLFLALTGFSKSTVRASLMLIVFFLGRILKRQADSKNSLGLAAIIVLSLNPFAGGDTGFLLSFFATLGILVVFPKLQGILRPLIKKYVKNYYVRRRVDNFVGIMLVSISTLVFTLPIVTIFIGNVSLVSPLSNLLITTLASLAIFLSGLAVLFSSLPILRAFENPFLLFSGLIAKYMCDVSSVLERIPYGYIDISSNSFLVLIAAVIIYIGFHIILCY